MKYFIVTLSLGFIIYIIGFCCVLIMGFKMDYKNYKKLKVQYGKKETSA
jgi:hypothetical protein